METPRLFNKNNPEYFEGEENQILFNQSKLCTRCNLFYPLQNFIERNNTLKNCISCRHTHCLRRLQAQNQLGIQEYNQNIAYNSQKARWIPIEFGRMTAECNFCKALHFYYEGTFSKVNFL